MNIITVNLPLTDDMKTMTIPLAINKNASLIPEMPIIGDDLSRLLNTIQQRETDILIEGCGTVNVALSLSFDNSSVYKFNKQYLRDSLLSNSPRNSDEIKKELFDNMKHYDPENTFQIVKQGKARVLDRYREGDMQHYFMFVMDSIAQKKQIIGDYKNIDNFGIVDGEVKIVDSDLLVDLLDDEDTIEFDSLSKMIVNDFIDYMISTEKFYETNNETSLMYLIMGLCCVSEFSDSSIGDILSILKKHPYCTDEHYHVFSYLLEFVKTDWQDKCKQIGCFSVRTTIDLFCMKIAFAKSYYGQPEKIRSNQSPENKEFVRDIQQEYNPVLMVNRLSTYLFRKPSWYQYFLEKLTFFKPLLCKYHCLSALNFFCQDSIKQRFIENQQNVENHRVGLMTRVYGFFSLLSPKSNLIDRQDISIDSCHTASQPIMVS